MCRLVLSNIWILTIWNQALHPERDLSSHNPKWRTPARFTAAVFKTWAPEFWRQKKLVDSCSFPLFLFTSSYILLHFLLLFSHLSFNFFPLPAKLKSEAPFATMFPSVTVLSQVLARYAWFCSMHRFVPLCCKSRCSENSTCLASGHGVCGAASRTSHGNHLKCVPKETSGDINYIISNLSLQQNERARPVPWREK